MDFFCHNQLLDIRFFFESQVSSSSFCWGWVDWGGFESSSTTTAEIEVFFDYLRFG